MVNHILNINVNMGDTTLLEYSKNYHSMGVSLLSHSAPLWSGEELKGYVLFVQRFYHPLLSASSQLILTRYYQHVRTHNNSSTQATVRLLESLIRLAQAHARLMMRNEVRTMVPIGIGGHP